MIAEHEFWSLDSPDNRCTYWPAPARSAPADVHGCQGRRRVVERKNPFVEGGMTMGKSRSRALVALCATVGIAVSGCSQIGMLKGKMAFQDANKLYQGQDYRAAAAKYEETINECRGSDPDCTDPRLTPAYFFLGNSYDQQYRAVKKGDAANDALLTKAIENYKKASTIEGDPKIKRLALDYLVSSYGPDKLNDPAQAEPILLSMIEMDPKETSSYFGLANIYEQSGDYERAEQMLQKAREMRPSDSAVYMQLA